MMSEVASASTSRLPQAEMTVAEQEKEEERAATFRRLHPRAYLERFLSEGFRPDGRECKRDLRATECWREVSVNVGSISTADGSALARVGDTTVVCGVKLEIAEPPLDAPKLGYLVPNIDLPAICSPRFKPGPPSDEAQLLSERIYDTLMSAEVIPLSSLCIHPGKSVWVIYVDATCINYDGNVFDAALIAMLAALKNTRLPKATYDEETGRTICSRKESQPLLLRRIPLSMSFGLFDSSQILPDPTSFEEPLLDSTISVIVDERGELTSTSQNGLGFSGSQEALVRCIGAAKMRRKELHSLVDSL